MHLYFHNVNDAFPALCRGFRSGKFLSSNSTNHANKNSIANCQEPPLSRGPSRYGTVITIEEPVTITYTEPLQRVLFHAARDANPFFHLIEALWMLAGCNRVQPLTYFTKQIAEFSDDDLTENQMPYLGRPTTHTSQTTGLMWGAYGYRWRKWFKQDQLEQAIRILRHDRITRRVVVQMWEPEDLNRVLNNPTCRDIPCNTEIMFRPRASTDTHRLHVGQSPSPREKELKAAAHRGELTHMVPTQISSDEDMAGCTLLDMAVINRSNDLLWGALGSNYVHFSFLHEYIANSCGMGVGHYHQISNNLHVYSSLSLSEAATNSEKWHNWEPDELCTDSTENYHSGYRHYPLFRCPINDFDEMDRQGHRLEFIKACNRLFEHTELIFEPLNQQLPQAPFFQEVVNPMLRAWRHHKARSYDAALFEVNQILPTDWRVACEQWLRRRSQRFTKAQENGVHANP